MAISIGDYPSTLFRGLSDFWVRFFRDTVDLEAFYQASEIYLGDAYLDLLSSVLNIGLVDTPVFNKEYWKLFTIREDELSFIEGIAASEDRFIYDMPGSIADIEVLQNTIFEPSVTLEKDVDFDILNSDGLVRFAYNIFRAYTDTDGNVLPLSGVAWRYIGLEAGNRLTDEKREEDWYANSGVKQGDTLRIIGHRGNIVGVPKPNDGTMTFTVHATFTVTVPIFTADDVGNIICVYDSSVDIFKGYYLIKEFVDASNVILEATEYVPTSDSPVGDLSWEMYRVLYLDKLDDYRIDYIDGTYLVGDKDFPYPVEEYPDQLVYAVARNLANPNAIGVNINTVPLIDEEPNETIALSELIPGERLILSLLASGKTPFMIAMTKGVKSIKDFHWVTLKGGGFNNTYGIYWVEVDNSLAATLDITLADLPDGLSGGIYTGITWELSTTAPETNLGHKHIEYDSFVPSISRVTGGVAVEGEDFSIDYLRGIFSPLKPLENEGIHSCSFKYQREITFSASGLLSAYTEGRVKQLSFWVPETQVDKFNLYYNYGSLLNRFEVSSDNYKAFLRGILYLYISGPILQRIEAAMNVAADLPVVRNEGEILTGYSDGIDDQNTDGQLVDAFTVPLKPYEHFITPSHIFTELDVGGYIVISSALNDVNRSKFKILNVIDANTVEIEAPYGVINEAPLAWVLTRLYKKTVTTDARSYVFDYNVPMREDVEDPENFGKLSFDVFEPLTEAFRVVDYVEDPNWWHNKVIPTFLWPNQPHARRIASPLLYENIIGPADDARIGDPGLYIGADDEGNISQVPGGHSARHCAAFILFDRYLKFHMFYVRISPELELDQEFITDLEELILASKPSYTYPYVEPAELLEDNLLLTETFQDNWGVHFGGPDDIEVSDNETNVGNALIIGGSPERFMRIGDYFRYLEYVGGPTGVTPPPIVPPPPFNLPIAGVPPAKQHVVRLSLQATKGGKQVKEGIDYTFDYDPTAPSPWLVTPHTVWDASPILFDALVIEIVNLADVPIPDTTLGFTPLTIGGTDPGYVRRTIVPPTYPLPLEYGNKIEEIDRTISLKIDVDGFGTPYVYP
jgi:hypothetical protein